MSCQKTSPFPTPPNPTRGQGMRILLRTVCCAVRFANEQPAASTPFSEATAPPCEPANVYWKLHFSSATAPAANTAPPRPRRGPGAGALVQTKVEFATATASAPVMAPPSPLTVTTRAKNVDVTFIKLPPRIAPPESCERHEDGNTSRGQGVRYARSRMLEAASPAAQGPEMC